MYKPQVPSPLSGAGESSAAAGQQRRPAAKRRRPANQQRKKKELTPRQKAVASSAAARAEWEKRIFDWQMRLFDGAVSTELVVEAAKYLTPSDYNEVVVERAADHLCGYPLCDKQIEPRKGNYRISRQDQKVYDISELKKFCSTTCFAASNYLKTQLLDEPAYMRNFDRMAPVEVIPAGSSISDIQRKTDEQSAPTSQRLLSDYVHFLLHDIPSLGGNELVIRENEAQPSQFISDDTDPRILAADYDAIEGYNVQVKQARRRKREAKSAADSPERAQEDIAEIAAVTEQIKKLDIDGEIRIGESIGGMTEDLDKLSLNAQPQSNNIPIDAALASPATEHLKPQRHGPAAPHRPIYPTGVFTSHTVIEDSPTSISPPIEPSPSDHKHNRDPTPPGPENNTHWRPSRLKGKLSLSLFGKIVTNLGRMVTSRTKAFARGEPYDRNFQEEDEASITRKQIFFQKVNTTVGSIRREFKITTHVNDDIADLINTLALSETLVVLSAVEQWVLCAVFIKVLCTRLPMLAQEIDHREKWKEIMERAEITVEQFECFVGMFT